MNIDLYTTFLALFNVGLATYNLWQLQRNHKVTKQNREATRETIEFFYRYLDRKYAFYEEASDNKDVLVYFEGVPHKVSEGTISFNKALLFMRKGSEIKKLIYRYRGQRSSHVLEEKTTIIVQHGMTIDLYPLTLETLSKSL